jgi:hypothetical protein
MQIGVAVALSQVGCPVSKLEAPSVQTLRAGKTKLPTAKESYRTCSVPVRVSVSQSEFTSMLRLSAASEGINIVRRRLFLQEARDLHNLGGIAGC